MVGVSTSLLGTLTYLGYRYYLRTRLQHNKHPLKYISNNTAELKVDELQAEVSHLEYYMNLPLQLLLGYQMGSNSTMAR